MVLRTLLGAGPPALVGALPRVLAPTQIVLAGARDLDRDEVTFVSNAAISLLTPADVVVPDRVAGRIRAAGLTRAYIHLDFDALDPVEFPTRSSRRPAASRPTTSSRSFGTWPRNSMSWASASWSSVRGRPTA